MAVIRVKELFDGRTGSDNLERTRNYIRMFEVATDDPEDDVTVAGGTPLLPRLGESHPNDEFAVVIGVEPAQSSQDFTLWYVTIRYSSDLPEDQQREALGYDAAGNPLENPDASTQGTGQQIKREDDPRARPPTFEVDWEETSEVVRVDINGFSITNSAVYPYDPPPMRPRNYPVLTITKDVPLNSPLLNIDKQDEWQEVTNSDNPWGRPEETLRMVRFKSSSQIENGLAYATVSVSIKFNWQTWVMKLQDAGYRDIDGGWFTDDETGGYPNDPILLDGAGHRLAAGADPVFIEWQIYRPVPFIPILALLGVSA